MSSARSRFAVLDLAALPGPTVPGGVVGIGNFDGMHRGHQAIIAAAKGLAARDGLPAYLLTFEPHPRTLFQPDSPLFRLTPAGAKARIAAALGLDGLVVAGFDRAFAAQTAEAFAAEILGRRLAARHVVVGPDFRFGSGRGGDAVRLAGLGRDLGFAVATIAPVDDSPGAPISSSRIRAALAEGDVADANALLGYRWFVEATVVGGEQRGRTLGYPTANMRLAADLALRHGIYAVWFDAGGVRRPGVASFGRRPTFDDGPPLLETFVFDFSGDLYGATARVTFAAYLRPELKFDGVDALVAQMDRDSAEARRILAAAGPGTALDRALAPTPR